jgi:hypothetical protein
MDSTKRLAPGDKGPSGTAVDTNGNTVYLEAAFAEGPTFLTFLRHFG